jgi:hypothetical protein
MTVGQRPKSHCLQETDAKAFRTSASEIPNCRAILDGVTPALKAALTGFNFPSVSWTGTTFACRCREILSESGRFLPRRFCSARMTESNRSISSSRRALTAFAKSLGKICRGEVLVIARDDEGAFTDANGVARLEVNENRSGVDDRPPMFDRPQLRLDRVHLTPLDVVLPRKTKSTLLRTLVF